MTRENRGKHQSQLDAGRKDSEGLLNDPLKAAQHLDALIKIVQRRYGEANGSANLGSFFVVESDVLFSDVERVKIVKKPQSQVLQIIAPNVPLHEEETRRAELQLTYSPLLLKFQKEAYMQVREMLLATLDDSGRKTLIDDLENYVAGLEKESGLR